MRSSLNAEDSWWTLAACRGMATETFFPNDNAYSITAQLVCNGCSVKSECVEEALRAGLEGVWGGTTEQQRRTMRRGAGNLRAVPNQQSV